MDSGAPREAVSVLLLENPFRPSKLCSRRRRAGATVPELIQSVLPVCAFLRPPCVWAVSQHLFTDGGLKDFLEPQARCVELFRSREGVFHVRRITVRPQRPLAIFYTKSRSGQPQFPGRRKPPIASVRGNRRRVLLPNRAVLLLRNDYVGIH